jgi:hypothetical protein
MRSVTVFFKPLKVYPLYIEYLTFAEPKCYTGKLEI